MATDDVIDPLFSAPLRAFVQERKRLAQALKQAGRRDEAKAVERLSKPTLSAWAVNQVARRQPERVRRLGVLTAELQKAHGPTFTALMKEHRALLAQLREDAEAALAGDGHPTGPHLLAKVVGNLRAGVAQPEIKASIEAGRLLQDVEEPGFQNLLTPDALAASSPDDTAEAPRPGSKGSALAVGRTANDGHAATATLAKAEAEEKAAALAAERRRAEAEQRQRAAEERRRRRTSFARELDKLAREDAAATRAVARHEQERDGAQRRLAEAEQRLEAARREHDRIAGERRRTEAALREAEAKDTP